MTNIERNVKQIDQHFHHGDLTQIDEKDFQRFNLHFQHCDLTGPPLIQIALDAKVTSRYRQTSEESTNILYNLSRFEFKTKCYFWSKEHLSTTDPRATMMIEKVKAEKRGSLDIADFSIPCLLAWILKQLQCGTNLIVTGLLGLRYELCTPH